VTSFPDSYRAARHQFRQEAARLGWECQPYGVGGSGPDGEDLTIDVARAPGEGGHVLIVSSGLHGVEGPLGSALQIEWMRRWDPSSREPGVRCVLIHTLNPYGYAWSRRVDADNVDLNRAFPQIGVRLQRRAEQYAGFDRLLNPRRPPSRWDFFELRAAWAAVREGLPLLREALVTGQHEFPKGLFFGGTSATRTLTLLERHMRSWIGSATLIAHLDVHTGLGRSGMYRLLIDYPLTAGGRDRLRRWFGPESFDEHDPQKVPYRARGTFGQWCAAQGFAREYVFALLEFGTYSNLSVLAGLRAENQAHHWGSPEDPKTVRTKARLRELFCPASAGWRSRALASGLKVIERARNGLTAEKAFGDPDPAASAT
jgi:hypothetical protein